MQGVERVVVDKAVVERLGAAVVVAVRGAGLEKLALPAKSLVLTVRLRRACPVTVRHHKGESATAGVSWPWSDFGCRVNALQMRGNGSWQLAFGGWRLDVNLDLAGLAEFRTL